MSFFDRRFFAGLGVGALIAVSLLNVAALTFAREQWLADHGGLIFHRKTPNGILHEISIPKALGRNISDWTLKGIDGSEVKLSSFSNKALFVNFWATWCAPCIAELPSIQRLQKSVPDSVAFLLITDENPELVKNFLRSHAFSLPVYIRGTGMPPPLQDNGIPVSYITDRHHRIVYQHAGAANWASGDSIQLLKDLADN